MEAIVPHAGDCPSVEPVFTPVFTRRPARKSLRLRVGESLFAEGDAAFQDFAIESGAIMVLRELPDGRRQILEIAGPGRTIGLAAEDRRDCSAVALRPSTVTRLDAPPSAEIMLGEIRRLRELALLLGRKTALERIASFLLEMMGEDFDLSQRLEFSVNRREIADYLGLALETVCRNFVALKKRGAIAPANRESVFIRDVAALRLIASGGAAA